MALIIKPTLSGYDVVFNFNGSLYQGNIPNELMPDLKELAISTADSIESNYFQVWADHLIKDLEVEVKQELKENKLLEDLVSCHLLTQNGGKYYRLNTTVSLPKELALEYIANQNNVEKIESLDNFWYFSALSEEPQREMLFSWLQSNEFQITKDGLIIAYRNVVKVNNDFTENVSSSYKIIKKRKKSPKNYYVDVNGNLTKENTEFNLFDTYHKNKITYTHEYNSPKRSYYTLGQESSLPRNEVNFENVTCSKGYHSFGVKFMENAGQSYFGNTTVCVLISPTMIASCPDNYEKMRSVSMYFCDTVNWEDGKIVPLSQEEIDYHSARYSEQFLVDFDTFMESEFDDNFPKFIGLNKKDIKERLIINQ